MSPKIKFEIVSLAEVAREATDFPSGIHLLKESRVLAENPEDRPDDDTSADLPIS